LDLLDLVLDLVLSLVHISTYLRPAELMRACSHALSLMGDLGCVCTCGDTYSFLIYLQTLQASAVIISVFQLDSARKRWSHSGNVSSNDLQHT